jgi:hypothetical protein
MATVVNLVLSNLARVFWCDQSQLSAFEVFSYLQVIPGFTLFLRQWLAVGV